jgi:hypothetical protein
MKLTFAPLAFLFAALAWPSPAAAQHTLEARIARDGSVYRQALRLTEGSQASYLGPAGSKQLILTALLTGGGAEFTLQYKLELSDGRGAQARFVQAQGEVALSPGEPLETLDCGPWKVTLTLDPAAKGAAPRKGLALASPQNYRLTADLTAAGTHQVCRLLSTSRAQSNMVTGTRQGDKRFGFILNALFAPEGGGFNLEYQIEQHPPSAAVPFELQNEELLSLNKQTSLSGEGYKLGLLLEGQSAPDLKGRDKPPTEKGYGLAQPRN